jgi:hypothetical protein
MRLGAPHPPTGFQATAALLGLPTLSDRTRAALDESSPVLIAGQPVTGGWFTQWAGYCGAPEAR